MLTNILIFIGMSMTPLVESRAAIPFALSSAGLNINPLLVFMLTIILNVSVGAAIYEGLYYIRKITKLHPPTHRWQESFLERAHSKLKPYIDKYGHWGLALFIAIPIPGSGCLTGAVAGQLLKIERKHYYIASITGVTIATIIIMAISLGFVTI